MPDAPASRAFSAPRTVMTPLRMKGVPSSISTISRSSATVLLPAGGWRFFRNGSPAASMSMATAKGFAGLSLHYGDKHDDNSYNALLVPSCARAGIAAFTGDGTDPAVFAAAAGTIAAAGGVGIPTVKPWDRDTLFEKLDQAKAANPIAVAMDIDAAGLPFLQGRTPPAGSKTVEELREVAAYAEKPFILKGIMTVRGAEKAAQTGAAAIVVSNHGGRVLDQCPATAEVLAEIVDAVGDRLTVLVDGGIRSGMDVFKALALGAKGVLIGRPFVTAVYGGEAEGAAVYVEKLRSELADTMAMCGVHSIGEISRDCVRR